MLSASFGRREPTENKFLLEARFYLEPVGGPLPGATNAVFALGYNALHAFLFRERKEGLSFGLDVLTKLGMPGAGSMTRSSTLLRSRIGFPVRSAPLCHNISKT